MKIVETTSQVLKRDQQGGHILDTVHSVEKTVKSLEPTCMHYLAFSFLVLVLLTTLLVTLDWLDLIPVEYDCIKFKEVVASPINRTRSLVNWAL